MHITCLDALVECRGQCCYGRNSRGGGAWQPKHVLSNAPYLCPLHLTAQTSLRQAPSTAQHNMPAVPAMTAADGEPCPPPVRCDDGASNAGSAGGKAGDTATITGDGLGASTAACTGTGRCGAGDGLLAAAEGRAGGQAAGTDAASGAPAQQKLADTQHTCNVQEN